MGSRERINQPHESYGEITDHNRDGCSVEDQRHRTAVVRNVPVCEKILIFLSFLLCIFTFPFSLFFTIRIVTEYQRAVIFRLGRLKTGKAQGPGMCIVMPCADRFQCVDMRVCTHDIPPQEILTRDSVTVHVDAVVYYSVHDACLCITEVENYKHSINMLAQTTLRNILGTYQLQAIMTERDGIAAAMQTLLDEATDPWGIKVSRVELKNVILPKNMQRAMAAEAEANRDAKAKVIQAEGEQKASRALKEAADVLSSAPAALQLRYLQTLTGIAAEKNSTIIFPLPMELMPKLAKAANTSNSMM